MTVLLHLHACAAKMQDLEVRALGRGCGFECATLDYLREHVPEAVGCRLAGERDLEFTIPLLTDIETAFLLKLKYHGSIEELPSPGCVTGLHRLDHR